MAKLEEKRVVGRSAGAAQVGVLWGAGYLLRGWGLKVGEQN